MSQSHNVFTTIVTNYCMILFDRPGSSTVYSKILYIDDEIRVVTNNAEDAIFVYRRST